MYHSPHWQDMSSSPVLPALWWCPAGPLRDAQRGGWGKESRVEQRKQGESERKGQREHWEWQEWAREKVWGASRPPNAKKEKKWRWENRKRADNSYQVVNEEPAEFKALIWFNHHEIRALKETHKTTAAPAPTRPLSVRLESGTSVLSVPWRSGLFSTSAIVHGWINRGKSRKTTFFPDSGTWMQPGFEGSAGSEQSLMDPVKETATHISDATMQDTKKWVFVVFFFGVFGHKSIHWCVCIGSAAEVFFLNVTLHLDWQLTFWRATSRRSYCCQVQEASWSGRTRRLNNDTIIPVYVRKVYWRYIFSGLTWKRLQYEVEASGFTC